MNSVSKAFKVIRDNTAADKEIRSGDHDCLLASLVILEDVTTNPRRIADALEGRENNVE